MTDWYTELWVPLRDWGLANPDKAIGTAFLVVGAPFVGWVWWRKNMRAKPEAPPPLEVKLETPAMPVTLEAPTPQIDTLTLNIETYEAQVRARIEAAQRMWEKAEGTEKESLGQQIGELQGRLENIEPAFDAAKARIVELEKLLEREGNQIGAERLERAENALAAGDFDEADALLAEISAEEDLAVQRKARAEYGRGQIAEEQVRWHDAAKHYGEAADLSKSFRDHRKATEFASKAGDFETGLVHAKKAVAAARDEFGDGTEAASDALNSYAFRLKQLGRYEEAEPLYREAIGIDKATIGEGHPSYAIRLNNLAKLLQDMGKPKEARPLYAEQLEIKLKTIGQDHPSTQLGAANYAILLRAHFPDDPALKDLEATFGPDIGK
ncbi:MAG: tetratricopeptide repeat protein [Paracoccaceae bacterium]